MPVTLEALRNLVAAKVQDRKLTAAEVQELAAQGPLTEEQKQVLAGALKSEYFASNAERAQAFALLGLAAPSPGAHGGGLVDKLKGQIAELAKDEVYDSHDVKVTDFKLGDRAGVKVRVQVEPFASDDPLVAGDPHRAATTRKMQEAGQKVTWAAVGGGLYPHGGFSYALPAGPAKINAGFSAGASIGYSVLAPYPLEAASLRTLGKDLTVDLPFDAAKARALTEGTEVRLAGRGTIAANVGVGAGAALAQLGSLIDIGASASAGLGVSKEGKLSVMVKRLEADKVFVSLSNVESRGTDASLRGRVVVDFGLEESVPEMGGALFHEGGQLVAKEVESEIGRWAKIDLGATYRRSKAETVVQNYELDLATPEGAQAYEDLLRLDARGADKLAASGSSAVAVARLDEVGRTRESGVNFQLGRLSLLRAISSSTEAHGVLDSRQGQVTYDRARLDESFSDVLSNLWAGKRAMTAELVQTARPGQSPESYLHLSQMVKGDKVTSKNDVRRFLALAQMLGAQGSSLAAAQEDKRFLSSFGKTDRSVDVYVTDQGLQALCKASPERLREAFAQTYETLDRPWDLDYLIGGKRVWTKTPWLANDQESHPRIIEYLESYPNSSFAEAGELDRRYRFLTGRDLQRDAQAYQQSRRLEALVAKLAQASTPTERAHVFAQADLGLDLEHELGTVALIAGAEQVMVNQLELHDSKKERDLTFVREGAIRDPKVEIDRILADPG